MMMLKLFILLTFDDADSLAMVEMKILLSSLYGRYSTVPDKHEEVPLESKYAFPAFLPSPWQELEAEQSLHSHFKSRSTNRDYRYFPNAGGRIVFMETA